MEASIQRSTLAPSNSTGFYTASKSDAALISEPKTRSSHHTKYVASADTGVEAEALHQSTVAVLTSIALRSSSGRSKTMKLSLFTLLAVMVGSASAFAPTSMRLHRAIKANSR